MQRLFSLLVSVVLALIPAAARAEDKVDFEKQILPLLVENCAKCHGEKMAAGKMRLHTGAALKEKWDADKELIVAGEPDKSELYKRLILPADDKKRMPKKADPLPKEKLDLIARWIKEGAALPAIAAAAPAAATKPADVKEGKPEEKKPAEQPLPQVAAAPQEAIDKLTAAGAQVMPLFGGSALLTVSFAHRSEPAGDAEVALLSGVAEQAYALNLADAKFTDAGLAPVAGLKNLAVLHLERTPVTDAGIAHLAGLANLQYLNLFGTSITDAGLKQLANLKQLRRLYLWQTKASYEVAMAMEKDIPGLEVNLGYNHPAVMRARLTKELEQVKKQVEEAKAEQTKVEQQLEAAKKNSEAVNAHQAEIDKQLKEAEAALTGAATPKPEDKAAVDAKAAADKAAAEKAAADKAAADKAAADKAAADKAAADKAAADKAAADKAAADKAAADKAAAEKAAAETKVAADKAAADAKAAADKAAAQKTAADKAAADAKAAADKAAAEKAAADKAAAEAKAAADKAAVDKAAADKAAAEAKEKQNK